MKHLIIYAHPNPKSLNSQLRDALISHLQRLGSEIAVRDLYQLNFDPVLSLSDLDGQRNGRVTDEVGQEQEFIAWADCISVIHPIWWTGLPAIMKGYIDRVFSYGFAYRYDSGVQKGLLEGKKVIIINTQGKSSIEYQSVGMDKALSLTSDIGIYRYVGLEIVKHFFFDQADRPSAACIAEWKNEIISTYIK